MHVQVVSKGIDASEALRQRVEDKLAEAVDKYFSRAGDAYVAISKEGFGFRADVSLHLPSGAMMQARGENAEAYGAVDAAVAKVEKRLRRYKRKLTDHRQGRDGRAEETALIVFQSTVSDDDEGALDDGPSPAAENGEGPSEPVIVAETTAELPVLTVGMAVHEMDLTQSPVLMFRNAAHGALNVVYRRADGHIGWIDPERPTS